MKLLDPANANEPFNTSRSMYTGHDRHRAASAMSELQLVTMNSAV
jgi:hypothetical protein